MPVTLRCIIENNNVDENVAKFMLPIGSAINMDGTALYEGIDPLLVIKQSLMISLFEIAITAVAAIFIAQYRNVELSFGKLIAIR